MSPENLHDAYAKIVGHLENPAKGQGVIIVDDHQQILYINQDNPFGYEPEELEYIYSLPILFHPRYSAILTQHGNWVKDLVEGKTGNRQMQGGRSVLCVRKINQKGVQEELKVSLGLQRREILGQSVGVGQYTVEAPKYVFTLSQAQAIRAKWAIGILATILPLFAFFNNVFNFSNAAKERKLQENLQQVLEEDKKIKDQQKETFEREEKLLDEIRKLTREREQPDISPRSGKQGASSPPESD